MIAAITALLGLIQGLVPAIGAASAVGKVITTLIEITPVLLKSATDVVPMVKNIIAALKSNKAITEEQWNDLDELEKQIDARFDAAAAAALAEDAAAKDK